MASFTCKTRIYTGPDSLSRLKELGSRRLLLVADPYFVKNGTAEKVLQWSGAEKSLVFHEVAADPTVELAAEGTARLREFDPDTVVALGGGSTIDCAKAMVYFSEREIPLVAIPTTSGSGSEVTDFAVLTHKGVKHPLVDARICPKVAILCSSLLDSLPQGLIADTGFDLLSHAMEAYVATGATAFSDGLAAGAFGTALALLPRSYSGQTQVRGRLHEAATMAGLAFNQAGLGLCHAMAHALGGEFHLPHGRLNGILLPAVLDCNLYSAGEKYAKLARSAGLSGTADTVAVRNLRNALVRLRQELKLPRTLKEAGVDPRQVWHRAGGIVEAVLQDPCCKTNPAKVEDYTVKKLLEQVTGSVG